MKYACVSVCMCVCVCVSVCYKKPKQFGCKDFNKIVHTLFSFYHFLELLFFLIAFVEFQNM